MSQRTGGGGDIHTAATSTTGSACTLSLSNADGADVRGAEVREALLAALAAEDVRELARLTKDYPQVAHRTPELADFIAWLARKGERTAVARILGERRRGRALEDLAFPVIVVLEIAQRENVPVSRAACLARERYPKELGHLTSRTLENTVSRYREHYERRRDGIYIPASLLLDKPFR